MKKHRSNLRSWFSREGVDEPSVEEISETLDHRLEPAEQMQFHLPGKAGLVREATETVEEIEPAEEGGSFLAITDRKLLFAIASTSGEVIIDIPHIDIRDTEIEDGFLTTNLSIDVWEDGIYRFQPAQTDQLEDIVSYLDVVSESWQIVDALLDEVHVKTSEVSEYIKNGRMTEANAVIEDAMGTLDEATAQIEHANLEHILGSRIEEAERELHRTRMRGLLAHATTLATEAKHQTDARAYTGAFERYNRARKYLETALDIAAESGFEEPPVIRSGLQSIEQRLEDLTIRPMALAKQARERAERTNNLDAEVAAWEEAFTHYRDALTAGWGTDYKFADEDEDIRTFVEDAVENLVRARREYAAELEGWGDSDRGDGNKEKAIYRYEQAIDQLSNAHELAREFRAGDVEAIEWELGKVTEKVDTLE